MQKLFTLSALAAALFLSTAPAQAQMQLGFMPYLGYQTGGDSQALIGVGGRIGTSFGVPFFAAFQPAVEVGLGNNANVRLDANLVGELSTGSVNPYLGAGLGVIFVNSNNQNANTAATELGLNLLGGLEFANLGFARPFVQGRLGVGSGGFGNAGGTAFAVQGGVIFTF